MIRYDVKDGALVFEVRVVARASRTCAVGEHDGALKVRVAAPPVEGAANEELVRFLARSFGVPARGVEILSGRASKLKRVRVAGADAARLFGLITETERRRK
ncbi:MAG TPA: DUF167 domain-containing protein [Pyrinomonadaceae bacterium]|nr:DUF167 domain-containing protein [Pyrinomonadaceae bacterium]